MPHIFQSVDEWLLYQLELVNNQWDNWHICTGEEGSGKSTWSRKVARRLDSLMRNPEVFQPKFPLDKLQPFSVDSIRFGQDDLLGYLVNLGVGGIAIGDEIEGHKRLAMTMGRKELLDHAKETRALGHSIWLGFPQFTQFEKDLVNTRFRWWEHVPKRGLVEIRQRFSHIAFDKFGEPYVVTKWPMVARFTFTDANDPFKAEYDRKKDARMRDRAARIADGKTARQPNGFEDRSKKPGINPVVLDQVLAELKR